MTQWCISCHHQLMPWVQTPGSKPSIIMWLLAGSVAKVRAPPWEACQALVFASSFCGSSSSYHEPPTMGIAVALSSIATAILLRWWRMMARWKANDPLRRSAWSAAHRAANCVVDRPPRWRLRIFVEIRRRQQDGSESYQIG